MTSEEDIHKSLKSQWYSALASCVDSDSWGQVLEASEGYERLVLMINKEKAKFKCSNKYLLDQIILCLIIRIQDLKEGKSSIPLEVIKTIKNGFQDMFTNNKFPVETTEYSKMLTTDTVFIGRDPIIIETHKRDSTPKIKISIEKIGLKYPETYIDPIITVSIKSNFCRETADNIVDQEGKDILNSKSTPPSKVRSGKYIEFGGHMVEFSISQEDLRKESSAIFFEFQHYKPLKAKNSTRCYAFIESHELKNGKMALELYTKPLDPTRKNLHLFTVKQLFLHLQITIEE